jgi:hypothetical protein
LKYAIVAFAVIIPNFANAETYRLKCDYFNIPTGEMLTQTCSAKFVSEQGRDLTEFRIGKRVVQVVVLDRQGVWARITFNGRPGMRYEHDRETFSYSNEDLTETLDTSSTRR